MSAPDPVKLSADLVRFPSVTPDATDAIAFMERFLREHGFACSRIDRGGTANLLARAGPKGAGATFGFNGHLDVVPAGPSADWSCDPFAGTVAEGRLWGRGACDMKTGVAAFAAAAIAAAPHLGEGQAILLAITGDEEGEGTHGTPALLDGMAAAGEAMTMCLVGEPTSQHELGDMMKIGRRGSLNARFNAVGRQGHSAYPDRAANPVPRLARLMAELSERAFDKGTDKFQPTTLAVTTIDVGNAATNVIPGRAWAALNMRFNDCHSGASLTADLERAASAASGDGVTIEVEVDVSGEAFLTPPGALSDLVAGAIERVTGLKPSLSTSGGTSDARFIRAHCPVVEFGLPGRSMHQVDEWASVDDIRALARIYERMLGSYFGWL